jgi:hypothetical protein
MAGIPALLAWADPQSAPQEIRVVAPPKYVHPGREDLCPGCDCPRDFCYTPTCDCRLPVSGAWASEMEHQLQARLEQAFAIHASLQTPPPAPAAEPEVIVAESETPPEAPPPRPKPVSPTSNFCLKQTITVAVLDPQNLVKFGSDQVLGYYGNGRISISSQLSRREAVIVLAHEMGHAWQSENNHKYQKVDLFLAEGFAEWVAYQALRCYGDGASAYKIRSSQDAVYGDGLRYFLDLENRGGSTLVFEIARSWLDGLGTRVSN